MNEDMLEDDADEVGARECPYCASDHDCEHLLLVVDETFRSGEGGPLADAFNARWSGILEAGGGDLDEREPFEELLGEVESIADAHVPYGAEGGPGMSSMRVAYFAESTAKVLDAVACFLARPSGSWR